MPSLDNLQPDQRAVLQMVLQRGHSYDEIANLLGIDRSAVRQRALDALDALTPMAVIPGPERALVTDYLLGQLPAMVAEQVLGYLAASEPDREWGLALSQVLEPLAPGDMPEIPPGDPPRADRPSAGGVASEVETVEPAHETGHEADTLWPVETEPPAEPEPAAPSDAAAQPDDSGEHDQVGQPGQADEPDETADPVPIPVPMPAPAATGPAAPRSSRLTARERERREAETGSQRRSAASGGRLWLWGGLTLAIVAAVVVIVVATSGSSSAPHHHTVTSPTVTTPTTRSSTSPEATGTGTGTTQTGTRTAPTATHTTTQLQRLALLHLGSPAGASGTTGVAQVVRARGRDLVVITAQGLPANTAHDAYAVWLSNSLRESVLIGWVQSLVGRSGVLSTEGKLPAGAGRYHRVLVTLETQAKPTEPGEVILSGAFREHS
jgi:hypothetical protein